MITADKLREVLDYDPETGVFRWKVKRKQMNPGDEAGRVVTKGYIQIRVDGERYFSHRLAWLYVYGKFPKDQIDHIDLNKQNNRIENLREATNSQNQYNRLHNKNSKSRCKGVHQHKCGKFVAAIRVNGRRIYLGIFESKNEAANAYRVSAEKFHLEFARSST